MTSTLDRMVASKEAIASVVHALESEDPSQAPESGPALLGDLAGLDEEGWGDLLSGVDDLELRGYLDSLRQKIRKVPASTLHRINQVGYSVSIHNFPSMSLVINLSFKTRTGSKSLDSTQDLEDTLWIGTSVIEAVSETMQSMKDALGTSVQRNCIGGEFEKYLMRAESAVQLIRERYNATASDADDSTD